MVAKKEEVQVEIPELEKVVETVQLEEDLEVQVVLNPNDMRVIFVMEDIQKLEKKSKKDSASDADGMKLMGLMRKWLGLLLSEDGFDEVIEYYVDKNDEFSLTNMIDVMAKIQASTETQKK